jgi:hypothetical protein
MKLERNLCLESRRRIHGARSVVPVAGCRSRAGVSQLRQSTVHAPGASAVPRLSRVASLRAQLRSTSGYQNVPLGGGRVLVAAKAARCCSLRGVIDFSAPALPFIVSAQQVAGADAGEKRAFTQRQQRRGSARSLGLI